MKTATLQTGARMLMMTMTLYKRRTSCRPVSVSVRPSVCLSVTSRISIETAERVDLFSAWKNLFRPFHTALRGNSSICNTKVTYEPKTAAYVEVIIVKSSRGHSRDDDDDAVEYNGGYRAQLVHC